MNKLGFAIKLASLGAGNAIECNKGQWINKVVDIREYLKLFNGLQGTDNIVTFMSFDEGGCFLTQLRAISGRVGDFLSGWIYIPNTIEASGEDVMNTYKYVRNILSQSNLNDCISDIESFFSKEYPKKEYAASYVPSSGEEFGVRYNDMYYSMKEILDTDRYQPYYSKYKAIFLLDKDGDVKISKEQVSKFKDLTKLNIDKTCIFKAPSPEEVRLLGRGTKIVFQNNQEFKSPVLKKKGDKVQLFAIRDGFEPVVLPLVMIQEDVQMMTIDPQTVIWSKRIKPSMFVVFNHNDEIIKKGVRISINGTDVTYQETLIAEEDCRQAWVKVSATDYETSEQRCNLLKEYCEITLDRKMKSLQATVELTNGRLAEMTIESKDLSSTHESPLKGYDYDEDDHGKSILRMAPRFVWKQRLLGFGCAIGLLCVIFGIKVFDAWCDSHEFQLGWPPVKEIQRQPVDNENGKVSPIINDSSRQDDVNTSDKDFRNPEDSTIIYYLISNARWSKNELEKYQKTKGLFDKINRYQFMDLASMDTYNCQPLEDIKEMANKMLSAKVELSGQYTHDDDSTITIKNWIDVVSKKINDELSTVIKSQEEKKNPSSNVNENK